MSKNPVAVTIQVGAEDPTSKWVGKSTLNLVDEIQDNMNESAGRDHDGAFAIVTMDGKRVSKTPITFPYMKELCEKVKATQHFYSYKVSYLPEESISFPEFVEIALDNFAIKPDLMDEYADLTTNREKMNFFASLKVEDVEDSYNEPIDEEGGYHGPIQFFLRSDGEPVRGAFISSMVEEPVLVRRHGARLAKDPVAIVFPDAETYWNEYAAGWAGSEGEPVGWEDRDSVLLEMSNYVALTEEGEDEVLEMMEREYQRQQG